MKEALYYTKQAEAGLHCQLCPHFCVIKNNKSGICGVRTHRDGVLYSDIYGKVTAAAMDPVEKKPLYHFHPASSIFSIGTKGCNLKCVYCQNHGISQNPDAPSEHYTPDEIVSAALKNNATAIAYTYSEPVIWIEFVLDCASRARAKGLKNVLVTNGHINENPLNDFLDVIDAMNIDLKSFNDKTSRSVHNADLSAVKNSIKRVASSPCHLEVTTLIVTDLNDTLEEMTAIPDFLASFDRSIPWHLSRYFPGYTYTAAPTNSDFMREVFMMAREKLDYVFTGNMSAEFSGSDSFCPQCNNLLIKRSGYNTQVMGLEHGRCVKCGYDTGIIQ